MKVIARKLLPKVDNKDIYKLNFMILSKILIIINIGDVNYLINSRLFGHNCKVRYTQNFLYRIIYDNKWQLPKLRRTPKMVILFR